MSEPLKPPKKLPEDGILLGYSLEHETRSTPIGFHSPQDSEPSPKDGYLNPLIYEGGNHLITIAPTGSGKGVSCVIPTLLRYQGPIIVVDPKGENHAVTARRRKEMGHKVIRLAPFEKETHTFNPLDMIRTDIDAVDDAMELARLMVRPERSVKDPFWDERAYQLIAALILYIKIESPVMLKNLGELFYLINQNTPDLILTIKDMLRSKEPAVKRLLGVFTMEDNQRVFQSILSTAQSHLAYIAGERVQSSLTSSSFDLEDITRGEPISIYLVVPPEKLETHGALIRLWVGTFMSAIVKRRQKVKNKTLFILDEAAQLGTFPHLRRAITLLRGYGVQTWSFWQDLSQLKSLYPHDWETMFNNSHVTQAFGTTNLRLAKSIFSLMGGEHTPEEILEMDSDEMALLMAGDKMVMAQKPNYLTDPCFKGLFDDNPYYIEQDLEAIAPQHPQRVYQRPTARNLNEIDLSNYTLTPKYAPSTSLDEKAKDEES